MDRSSFSREPREFRSEMSLLNSALGALHFVLVKARFHALTGSDSTKVARILDEAEQLVVVLMRSGNPTQEYRAYLVRLGEALPEFAGLVEEFDRQTSGELTLA